MAPPPSHSQAVLPNPQVLVLEAVQCDPDGFVLSLSSRQVPQCPDCGKRSRSFHSSYLRCLQDLPWQGQPVRLQIRARRFRCRNLSCARKIFVERLPNVALAYARQTDRLREIIRCVGFVTGGLPGSRLLARLAILVSDDTVLRLVKIAPAGESSHCPVECVGVDDWAWRKGQEYGTILVDLEQHCVLDLLPERSTESLAAWFKQHPTVAFVSRDRAGVYAEGAQQGAPHAQQVADRFHLFLNLSAAIERALEERLRQLQAPVSEAATEPDRESVQFRPKRASEQLKEQRRERRLQLYEQVMALYREGHSQRAIGQTLSIQRKTVRRWLRAGQFPERKPALRKPAQVQQYTEYLRRRWTEGCHNATQLFEEIRSQGYRGQRGMVAELVSGWRAPNHDAAPVRQQNITPHRAAVLTMRTPEQLTAQQQTSFNRLSSTCPDLQPMRSLALEFRCALSSKDSKQIQQWIQRAKESEIKPLARFALSLRRDLSAVTAAVESPLSNGQVEGQINRLKMIKRQMYGRAGIQLLHARILPYRTLGGCAVQRAP